MSEILQARVCAWCFNMQLRADPIHHPKDVSACFRNILHDAQISSKIPLDMVSFAWSPDANGGLVDISGFIRAHDAVRGGTIVAWMQDERITEKVAWKPCDGEKGKHWTSHPLIAQYLTESSSNGRTREFWKWDAELSILSLCAGMPTASKRGPKKQTDSAQAKDSEQTAAAAGEGASSAIPPTKRRRKPSQTTAADGGSSSPPPKRKSAPVPAAQSSSQLLQQGMSDTEAIDQIRKLPLPTLQALWKDHYVAEKTVPRTKQACLAAIFDRVPAKVVYQAAMNVFGAQAFGSAGAAAAQPATEAGVATASAAESAAAAGSAAQHGMPRGRPAASVSAETVPQQPSPFPPPTPPPPPPTAAAVGGASAPALANTSPPQAATHAAQASSASYAAAAGGGGLMTPGPPPPPPHRDGACAAGAAAGRADPPPSPAAAAATHAVAAGALAAPASYAAAAAAGGLMTPGPPPPAAAGRAEPPPSLAATAETHAGVALATPAPMPPLPQPAPPPQRHAPDPMAPPAPPPPPPAPPPPAEVTRVQQTMPTPALGPAQPLPRRRTLTDDSTEMLSVSCYLFVSSDCMRQCSNSSTTDNVQQAD